MGCGDNIVISVMFSDLYEIVPNYHPISCIKQASGDTEILLFMTIGFIILRTVIILQRGFLSDKESLD